MSFARSGVAQFLASTAGRALRVVAGLALMLWGFFLGGAPGFALLVVGLVPIAAGSFDFCLLTGLLGGPFSGERVRHAGHGH